MNATYLRIVDGIKSLLPGENKEPRAHRPDSTSQSSPYFSTESRPQHSSQAPERLEGALKPRHESLSPLAPDTSARQRLPGAAREEEEEDCKITHIKPVEGKNDWPGLNPVLRDKGPGFEVVTAGYSFSPMTKRPGAGPHRPVNTLNGRRTPTRNSAPITYGKKSRTGQGYHKFFTSDDDSAPISKPGQRVDLTTPEEQAERPWKKQKTARLSTDVHQTKVDALEQTDDPIEDAEEDLCDAKRAGGHAARGLQSRRPVYESDSFHPTARNNHITGRTPKSKIVDLSSPVPIPSSTSQKTALDELAKLDNHFNKEDNSNDDARSSPTFVRKLQKASNPRLSGHKSSPVRMPDPRSLDESAQVVEERTQKMRHQPSRSSGDDLRVLSSYPKFESKGRTLHRVISNATELAVKNNHGHLASQAPNAKSAGRRNSPTRPASRKPQSPEKPPNTETRLRLSPEVMDEPRDTAPIVQRVKDRMRDTSTVEPASDVKSKKKVKRDRRSSADVLSGPSNVPRYPVKTSTKQDILERPTSSQEHIVDLSERMRLQRKQESSNDHGEKADVVDDSEPGTSCVTQPSSGQGTQKSRAVPKQSDRSLGASDRMFSALLTSGEPQQPPKESVQDFSQELEIREATTYLPENPAGRVSEEKHHLRPSQEIAERRTADIAEPRSSQLQSDISDANLADRSQKTTTTTHEEVQEVTPIEKKGFRASKRLKETKPQQYIDLMPQESMDKPRWIDHPSRKPWKNPLTYPPNAPKQVMVNWSDLERLEEDEMLNDNLIAFELRRLEIKHDRLADQVHFFNSYFYDSLTKGPNGRSAFKYDNVKSWTRKVDLFKYPYIIVPVNSAAHWYVFIICNADKLLETNDLELEHNDTLVNSSQPLEQGLELPVPNSSQTEMDDPTSLAMQKMSLDATDTEAVPPSSSAQPSSIDKENLLELNQAGGLSTREGKAGVSKRRGRQQNPDAPLIIALDSMGKPHSTEIGHLKQYLVEEAKHKRGQSITKADITSISAKGIPAQTNMFDCGVFLLGYMDTFLRDPRLFVEKVCSRDMDENNDFAEFDPAAKRNKMRDFLVKFHRRQTLDIKDAKAKKRKASDADGGGLVETSSPMKRTKTGNASIPSSSPATGEVDTPTVTSSATIRKDRSRSRSRLRHSELSSPAADRSKRQENVAVESLLTGMQEAARDETSAPESLLTGGNIGAGAFLDGIGVAASQP